MCDDAVHLMCGVKTNVVTAVQITDRFAGDSPLFKPLVEATGQNFTMAAVSADKAYLSVDNLQTVLDHNAMPYIPFKSNSDSAREKPKPDLASDVLLLCLQSTLLHATLSREEQR
jgi:hypothetical protein